MMQVTAPAIMAAQHGADDSAVPLRNETHARITPQICGNGAARVGFVQPHPFRAPPQSNDRVVILNTEGTDNGSIVVRAVGNLLFHSTVPFSPGFHGLG